MSKHEYAQNSDAQNTDAQNTMQRSSNGIRFRHYCNYPNCPRQHDYRWYYGTFSYVSSRFHI